MFLCCASRVRLKRQSSSSGQEKKHARWCSHRRAQFPDAPCPDFHAHCSCSCAYLGTHEACRRPCAPRRGGMCAMEFVLGPRALLRWHRSFVSHKLLSEALGIDYFKCRLISMPAPSSSVLLGIRQMAGRPRKRCCVDTSMGHSKAGKRNIFADRHWLLGPVV